MRAVVQGRAARALRQAVLLAMMASLGLVVLAGCSTSGERGARYFGGHGNMRPPTQHIPKDAW